MSAPRLVFPLFLVTAAGISLVAAADSTRTLSATFGAEIQETGLAVERKHFKADPDGGWAAQYGSDSEKGWHRVIRFDVTDQEFLAGKYPVVDLEMTVRTAPSVLLNVEANTTDGFQSLLKERMPWRNPEEWRTRAIQLDNFAPQGSTDLMLTTANALTLKDIKIVGYDLEKNVDWSRVLRIGDPVGPQEGGVLLFQQGGSQQFTVPLKNLARIPCPIRYSLQISSLAGPVQKADGEITLPPGSSDQLTFTFDTDNLPLGPYEATLEILQADASGQKLLSRKFRLGLISGTELGKARDGEFLFGLDPANNFQHAIHTPATFAYFRLMGVDILRNPYNVGMEETVENAEKSLKILAEQNLRTMIMVDPPKDKEPEKRAENLQKKVDFLKELARKHAGTGIGKYHFYELGNEPDLPFFYPHTIPDYLDSYYAMYDAVKEGAAEAGVPRDGTVVMNGGLSFAHDDGVRRSREFIEFIDTNRIDAIAYHGHGPGIEAERMAYERIRDAARKYGKDHMPFIETESGVMATDTPTLQEQARTVVEKLVYAQSVGQPFLMYFRLIMREGHEGGYGMTERIIEPRPSALSYRNMVERLRHQSFVRLMDFAAKSGAEGVNGYLFEGRDKEGQPTPKKTVLVFSERDAKHNLLVRLGPAGTMVSTARLYDMYGNTLPLEIVSGNVASFSVGPDPVYLSWESPGGIDTIAVLPPLLRANLGGPLLTGETSTVTLSLFNPTDKPLDVGVKIAGHARVSIQTSPTSTSTSLLLNQPTTLPVNVTLGQADEPLRLPDWWKVFLDVDGNSLTQEQLATIPTELAGKEGTTQGEYVWTPDQKINFAKLAGGYSEWRAGTAFAYLDSPSDGELTVAAVPDFWMTWFINGEKVYDVSTDRTRGGGNFGSHTFKLPLKAGRNILAVTGFSGRGGWLVSYAGPKELAIFQSGGVDPDRLTVMISDEGKTIAQADVPLELQGPISPLGDIGDTSLLKNWMPLGPLTLLASSEITNLWVTEPDQTRWYQGEADLSAVVWVRQTAGDLQVFLSVRDDTVVTAPSPDQLPQFDSVRLVLTKADGEVFLDASGGIVADSVATIGSEKADFAIQRTEEGRDARTLYHITIPKSAFPGNAFRLNLSIRDNDAGYLKQTLDLGKVDEPQRGRLLSVSPEG